MFEGAIFFVYENNHWKVRSFFRVIRNETTKLTATYPHIKEICLEGKFNFNPVRGQFCKSPHKLINWSKS